MNQLDWISEGGLLALSIVVVRWAKPIVESLVASHLAFVTSAREQLESQSAKLDAILERLEQKGEERLSC